MIVELHSTYPRVPSECSSTMIENTLTYRSHHLECSSTMIVELPHLDGGLGYHLECSSTMIVEHTHLP